jgi:hypothetical protein
MSQSVGLGILRSVAADVNRRTGIEQRFWTHVAKGNNCWNWIGWQHRQGYGMLRINQEGESTMHLAHRVSWMIANRWEIPELDVLHKCDNPPCVRPDHLFLGTHAQNMADMVTKGRSACGERSGSARLTWTLVKELRRIYRPHHPEFGAAALARKYNMSYCAMYGAITGYYWRSE